MNTRQDTDTPRQATGTAPDRVAVDVATAAKRLGITPDAVRGRLRRKSLAGELRSNGQWVIYLDPEPVDRPPTSEQQDTAAHQHDTATALIEALQAQVLDLQRRLDRQDVNMQLLIAKLPNPDGGSLAMIETGTYRQDAPTASPDATSEAAAVPSTPDTLRRRFLFWRGKS
jgi:uncharacterized coiled-coil protein SlyX